VNFLGPFGQGKRGGSPFDNSIMIEG